MPERMTLALAVTTGMVLATAPAHASASPAAPSFPAAPPGMRSVRIHDIQGSTRVSPLNGEQVRDVPGVVTGVRRVGPARGFWFQDPRPDGDPRTSEGLFVFTGARTPQVHRGDVVSAAGTVTEYYPTSDGQTPQDTPNQSVTELRRARWQITGRAPVPAAEVLQPGSVPHAYAPRGNLDEQTLDPTRYALDFYESREGMVVQVNDAAVVGPTDDGALWTTTKPGHDANPRGGTGYFSYDDPNGGRLKVESLLPADRHPFPRANVGDHLRGATAGPLDYSSDGGYTMEATELGQHVPGGLHRETTRDQRPGELAVAGYNVENVDAADDQAKFDRLGHDLAHNLAAPDIVALQEMQDNDGPRDDGVVAADRTLQRLTDAVEEAGGPQYQWRQIDPVNDADGGEPGGNIRVAFLYNPERVSFVDRPGGTATRPVHAVDEGGHARLDVSPGRIDPGNPAWRDSRKPLVGEFRFGARTVFVAANHFNSKGDDQPLHSRFQPPQRSSERQRLAEARSVRRFVDQLRGIDPDAAVVVTGDLNDFDFSPAVRALTEHGGLRNEVDSLPQRERYGYVYQGNSQALDQMLTSPGVGRSEYDIVHTNAEFADQVSDHDPHVLRFQP